MMEMLSKMDKTELEQNLNKVSKILNSKDADRVIDEIKKNTERRNEYGKKSRRTQLQSQSPYSHVQRTGTESILAIHAKQNQAEYRLCLLQ